QKDAQILKINLVGVIRLFQSVFIEQAYPRSLQYSKDVLSDVFYIVIDCLNPGLNKIGYSNILQVPPVVLCYHSVPSHHIKYNPRSAPVFLSKLVYDYTCASSLFPPLLVYPES
ncbi:hypothetical protein PAEPH01_1692, partial [Pancytospora epiphaga]